jgi:formylglycine-generating enzyme required for sulfatase activity/dienelactone hydrolase
MSVEYSINTAPIDARIYVRDYGAVDREWEYLGKSPIERVRLPMGFARWRVEKEGFNTVEGASVIRKFTAEDVMRINFSLDREGSVPSEMVRVPGGRASPLMANIFLSPVQLAEYLIDKYEVTNKQYKEFIAAGGYQKREYWRHSFVKEGRVLTWEEAMSEFRDTTGRPGPSTWEFGEYPEGQDDHPVGGLSWYEAAAYAEFRGKSLPTLYHWARAAALWGLGDTLGEVPLSNFGGSGPARVGTYQGIGPFGTYDLAGNVREWCWNESAGNRCIMGGAWNEPSYVFHLGGAQPPFDRSSFNGFRCVLYLDAIPEETTHPLPLPSRDYSKEKPASDDIFKVYESLFAYDRAELGDVIESEEEATYWIKQKVRFNAANVKERIVAYLYLPKNAAPPYQTVIYFPWIAAFNQRSSPDVPPRTDFIIRSGRAVLFPIYKGTYERWDGFNPDPPYTTASFRDHIIEWSKEVARAIDYLETRPDIDRNKIGFYGFSYGARVGITLLGIEKRFSLALLKDGGLTLHPVRPEVDPVNFAPRIHIPVLLLNGRYDQIFPLERSQYPLVNLLGTPEKDKRHIIFEASHGLLPKNQVIKESLNWFDHYWGSVNR